MIKIENTVIPSPEQWKAAILGVRNPMNSWKNSDSGCGYDKYGEHICNSCDSFDNEYEYGMCKQDRFIIGQKDLELMKRLRNAGTDHRKFMRMITVYVDITAPLYWWKEFDTYKVGTVANSCSTMHKIHEKEFALDDFSCEHLISEYTTKDYFDIQHDVNADIRPVVGFSDYDVGADGVVYSWKSGKRAILKPRVDIDGYKTVGLYSGGKVKRVKVHRLVAEAFLYKEDGKDCVNHRDGNKWNNSIDNLEWCTRSENSKHACENGLNVYGSKQRDGRAKQRRFSVEQIGEIKSLYQSGMSQRNIGKMYGCDHSVISEIVNDKIYKDIERLPLEQLEYTIEILNSLRTSYNKTGDKRYWYSMIQLLPSSYNQKRTVMLNYEVLANIYKSRKNHKLDEWSVGFVNWIKSLPYSELITGEINKNE